MLRDLFSALSSVMPYIICFAFGYAFGCVFHD